MMSTVPRRGVRRIAKTLQETIPHQEPRGDAEGPTLPEERQHTEVAAASFFCSQNPSKIICKAEVPLPVFPKIPGQAF